MNASGNALAEGFFWHAEKLLWGYPDTEQNPPEAYRLFKQAASLGFSDALLRLGTMQEYGRGTAQSLSAAVASYRRAIEAGNFLGFAYLALLVSRAPDSERTHALWSRYFSALEASPDPPFLAVSPGEMAYRYIETQLKLGLAPQHVATLRRYRLEIAIYQQRLLEHLTTDQQLGDAQRASNWIKEKLGPWPASLM